MKVSFHSVCVYGVLMSTHVQNDTTWSHAITAN